METQLTDLYERSGRYLRSVAARYIRDEAEDVVQDAFVSALCSAREFRRDAAPLTWVHRIVRNAAIDRYRKRVRREELDGRFPDRHLRGPSTDIAFAVRAALGDLTTDQRRIFVMYDVIGFTHNEIAKRLSIPSGTSKSRLSEARRDCSANYRSET